MRVVLFLVFFVGCPCVGTVNALLETEVCYNDLGCFSTKFPFTSFERLITFLPQSPDIIRAYFRLFTRESSKVYKELDARYVALTNITWPNFKVRPTKFIIHGFTDGPDNTPWQNEMKDELLKQGDYNVVVVDWSKGSSPPYTQATANTRVVGALIARLISQLKNTIGIRADQFHIIGHSLGAHTAGYAGERVSGLGRISGLDPAGPNFENTAPAVRLDETDAIFVDVIHSNARPIIQLGLGTRTVSGHVDYFPNLGQDQPGCPQAQPSDYLKAKSFEAVIEFLACSHLRAVTFFNESINSRCPYLAYPCNSDENFQQGLCNSCPQEGCGRMGFYADQNKPKAGQRVKYYLTTGGTYPFCRFHTTFRIRLSYGLGSKVTGTLALVISGKVIGYNKFTLPEDSNSQTFAPGQTYMFQLMTPYDFGDVQSVTLTWKSDSTFNIFGFLGNSNTKLYVNEVSVDRKEINSVVKFCAQDQALESGKSLVLSSLC